VVEVVVADMVLVTAELLVTEVGREATVALLYMAEAEAVMALAAVVVVVARAGGRLLFEAGSGRIMDCTPPCSWIWLPFQNFGLSSFHPLHFYLLC